MDNVLRSSSVAPAPPDEIEMPERQLENEGPFVNPEPANTPNRASPPPIPPQDVRRSTAWTNNDEEDDDDDKRELVGEGKAWYRRRRFFIIFITVIVVFILGLGIGLGVGLSSSDDTGGKDDDSNAIKTTLQPTSSKHDVGTAVFTWSQSPTDALGTARTSTVNASLTAHPTTFIPSTTIPPPRTSTVNASLTAHPTTFIPSTTIPLPRVKNCSVVCDDIDAGRTPSQSIGLSSTGAVATILPDFSEGEGLTVYCECENKADEAWMVFQRRMDGSVAFNRSWTEYANGFGNVYGEYWLGLEAISNFTSKGGYEMKVDLEHYNGASANQGYGSFSVANASQNYNLSVGVDSYSSAGDGLDFEDGQAFTTWDNDHDKSTLNCALEWQGAWWFNDCFRSHLNGRYYQKGETVLSPPSGIVWGSWFPALDYSLKSAEMKFRKKTP